MEKKERARVREREAGGCGLRRAGGQRRARAIIIGWCVFDSLQRTGLARTLHADAERPPEHDNHIVLALLQHLLADCLRVYAAQGVLCQKTHTVAAVSQRSSRTSPVEKKQARESERKTPRKAHLEVVVVALAGVVVHELQLHRFPRGHGRARSAVHGAIFTTPCLHTIDPW